MVGCGPYRSGAEDSLPAFIAGRVFDAEEACAAGLVSTVVAPEAVVDTARALAREIADNTSAMSVALSRQLLWCMLGADHPMEAHKVDSRCIFS